jgi:hypothetical protein
MNIDWDCRILPFIFDRRDPLYWDLDREFRNWIARLTAAVAHVRDEIDAFCTFLCEHQLTTSAFSFATAFGGRLAKAHKHLAKEHQRNAYLAGCPREPSRTSGNTTADRHPAVLRQDEFAGIAWQSRPSQPAAHPIEYSFHVRIPSESQGTGPPVEIAA